MTARGITMIDAIQGPPRWGGPDLLLRQTSFRALAEPRRMRLPDGTVTSGELRVRFGEVEARGIAPTRAGRARYDALLAEVDRRVAAEEAPRPEIEHAVWTAGLPSTERGLIADGLAHFTYHARRDRPADGRRPPAALADLLDGGWIRAEPIVYEDFLPRSAAGIFQSNLTGKGTRDDTRTAVRYDRDWLAGALGRDVHDPFDLYGQQQDESIARVARSLQLLSPAS
jgi:uncharacterized glyoxalase superfamily metalloenzyme YdcJ